MDIAPIDPGARLVFNPLLGFSTLTAPEIVVEEYPIKPGNWFFDRQVLKRAAIGAFSVQRGVTFSDSDFWRWTMTALTGGLAYHTGISFRRTFILIHFFARNPIPGTSAAFEEANKQNRNFGPFEFAIRVPAKAYLLKGCIPTKWRAGNSFDAMSAAVSIAELDFSCEMVEEISLAGGESASSGVSTTVSALSGVASVVSKVLTVL